MNAQNMTPMMAAMVGMADEYLASHTQASDDNTMNDESMW